MIKTISHIILSALFFILTVGISINKQQTNISIHTKPVSSNIKECSCSVDGNCKMSGMPMKCEIAKKSHKKNNPSCSCSCQDKSEYIHFYADYVVPEKLQLDKLVSEYNIIIYQTALCFDNINTLFFKQTNYRDAGNSSPNVPDRLSLFQVFRC